MLKAVISGGTTSDNLNLHTEGGRAVTSVAIIGSAFKSIDQSYVQKAIKLLINSYQSLGEYFKATGDEMALLERRGQLVRINYLSKRR